MLVSAFRDTYSTPVMAFVFTSSLLQAAAALGVFMGPRQPQGFDAWELREASGHVAGEEV